MKIQVFLSYVQYQMTIILCEVINKLNYWPAQFEYIIGDCRFFDRSHNILASYVNKD
jgi:hypothetical protein